MPKRAATSPSARERSSCWISRAQTSGSIHSTERASVDVVLVRLARASSVSTKLLSNDALYAPGMRPFNAATTSCAILANGGASFTSSSLMPWTSRDCAGMGMPGLIIQL